MLEDLAGQRVPERQLGQDVGVGRVAGLGASGRGQLERLEEDVGELLGRGDGELLAGQGVDLAGEGVQLALQLLREVLQAPRIDADAVALHHGEDGHQRPLDVLVDPEQRALLQLGARAVPEAPEPSRPLSEHRAEIGAGPGRGQRRRTGAEGLHADVLEAIARPRGIEQVRRDRAVIDQPRPHAGVQPPLDERLGVVHEERALAKASGQNLG